MAMEGPPSRHDFDEKERERWNKILEDNDADDNDNDNNSISQEPTSSATWTRGKPRTGDPSPEGSLPTTAIPDMSWNTALPSAIASRWLTSFHKQPSWSPDTLSTAILPSTTGVAAHPDHGEVSTTTTPPGTSKTRPGFPTTTHNGFDEGNFLEWNDRGEPKNSVMYAVAGVVPVVVLTIIGVLTYFYLRKRKRQREMDVTQAKIQEMESKSQTLTATHYGAPPSSPLPAAHQYSLPPATVQALHAVPSSPTIPQPVILGPIAPASNGAYFTGIDTSDMVSMNDRTGLGNPFADSNSLSEEPPPPYRPRSLPPISRDSSVRTAVAAHSRTNLIAEERSPFADPVDDDAVSILSGNAMHQRHDTVSIVSDLSYQDEPVVARRAI